MTDGRGGKTTNEYDDSNRVVSQTDPMKRTTDLGTTKAFQTTITDKATGAVTNEWFNQHNQPDLDHPRLRNRLGQHRIASPTPQAGAAGEQDRRQRSHDDLRRTTGRRQPDQRTAIPKATKRNGPSTVPIEVLTDDRRRAARRRRSNATRDGNPKTISRPAPGSKTQTVSYVYGPHGEVEIDDGPAEPKLDLRIRQLRRPHRAKSTREGDKRTWAYNEDSQVISTVSPRGNVSGRRSLRNSRPRSNATRRAGRSRSPTHLADTTKYAYDADGNVESITDPNGHKTKFTYDADNEPTKVERPNGTVEETGYDGAGRVTSQIDGNEQTKRHTSRNVLEQAGRSHRPAGTEDGPDVRRGR